MLEWLKVSLLLCTFGLLRELRPSEPYVSEFILGPWRNITEETLNKDVYPVGTYSYLSLLVVVFLVTDYLKYKPLIIVSGLCGIAVYAILLWTASLEWLQVSQFFYGLYVATEVAYYTYMFAKVDEEHYEKVSSWTRAAALVGRFISGVSAQLLVSFSVLNLRELNYITFTSQVLSILWAILLPNVDRSIYFHRDVRSSRLSNSSSAKQQSQVGGLGLLWEHTRSAYTRPAILAWSVWYAVSSAFFVQVQSYMQLLWREISPHQEHLYNGFVEAALTVLGACAALLAGRGAAGCKGSRKFLLILPAVVAAVQGTAALVSSFAEDIWLSYVVYVILGALFHYMITIASSEIARKLVYDSCFGLIFGINTLFAAILQSLLTLIVISEDGLELSIRGQYKAYAICYYILSAGALIACFSIFFMRYRRNGNTGHLNADTESKMSNDTVGNVVLHERTVMTVL